MRPVVFGCVVSLLAAGSLPVAAQSLTELARLEKLRREALAAKAAAENLVPKVYTNADLRGGGRLTTGTVQTQPPATSETESEAAPPDEDTPEPDAPLTEEQWRDRINNLRQERDRAQLLAEALQSRVDGLWADFTARDNPVERSVIEQNRLAAVDELENTIAAVEDLDQELADIQDEARRANVPPGWLR
jgi:hypothetical protein